MLLAKKSSRVRRQNGILRPRCQDIPVSDLTKELSLHLSKTHSLAWWKGISIQKGSVAPSLVNLNLAFSWNGRREEGAGKDEGHQCDNEREHVERD